MYRWTHVVTDAARFVFFFGWSFFLVLITHMTRMHNAQRAVELGIPVVSEEWLAQCLAQVGR